MYVDESYRGLGLNQRIMDKLIAWGREQGLCDFYLDVYAGNQSAIKAYEKSGFKPSMIEMKLTLK
jgi:GNAT superfamily N-acetyltransferase